MVERIREFEAFFCAKLNNAMFILFKNVPVQYCRIFPVYSLFAMRQFDDERPRWRTLKHEMMGRPMCYSGTGGEKPVAC